MSANAQNVDRCLARSSDDNRAALEKIRRAIQSAAPKAEECIGCRIPGFRLGGRLLASFGAAANRCAFRPGTYPIRAHRDELGGCDAGKGTIRFPADRPLPAALVRKLVKTRIAECPGRRPLAASPERTAELEAIGGAGRFPWKDAPDRYCTVVDRFVKKAAAPPA